MYFLAVSLRASKNLLVSWSNSMITERGDVYAADQLRVFDSQVLYGCEKRLCSTDSTSVKLLSANAPINDLSYIVGIGKKGSIVIAIDAKLAFILK